MRKTVLASIIFALVFCVSIATPVAACTINTDTELTTGATIHDVDVISDTDDLDEPEEAKEVCRITVRYIAADTMQPMMETEVFHLKEGDCFEITPQTFFGYRALPAMVSEVAERGGNFTYIVWFIPYEESMVEEPVSVPISEFEIDDDRPRRDCVKPF